MAGISIAAVPATAAPVYEITGEWAAGTPAVTSKGSIVNSIWRVNVNDSAQAPGNDPVANVNFNVTLQHGLFKSLPDLCKTSGVTPPSSLSADNRTLVCNLGTQLEGTAHAVQAAIVVDGTTGEEVSATGTIAGKTATIPPIPITNGFGMDMEWGTPTSYWFGGPGLDADYGFDLEWTLRALSGSDPGPQTITYNLTITTQNGAPIVAGTRLHSECMPYSIGNTAPGHPWSGGDHPADQMAPFVETCTLTQTGPTTFQLTLSGIDYSMLKAPTKDSAGNSLGTTWTSIASGSIWLTLQDMPSQTSVSLQSTAPIYTSTTGATYTDVASNNTSTKAINPSGNWAAAWYRGFHRFRRKQLGQHLPGRTRNARAELHL